MSKYVLFSPIGDHDPISTKDNTEGAMLHIVRNEKIEVVVLFLTKEMQDKAMKDNRYEIAIKKINPAIEVMEIKDGVKNANDFDFFMNEFPSILTNISKTYPDYKILLNVSSGTPQIKLALLNAKLTTDLPLELMQVDSPNKASNTREDNFKIEMLDTIKTTENRCHKPNLKNYKRTYLLEQIKILLSKYEYSAIYDLIKNTNYFENKDEILKQIQEALDIINCKESNVINYFWIMNLMQKKGQLNYMILQITPLMTQILYEELEEKISSFIEDDKIAINRIKDKKLLEYLNSKYNDNFKGSYVNFNVLLRIYEFYNDKSAVISHFKELEKITSKRNSIAHTLTSITENDLKEFGGSTGILKNMGIIINNLIESIKIGDFVFDKINEVILKLIK